MANETEDIKGYVRELREELNKNTIRVTAWEEGFIINVSEKMDKYVYHQSSGLL